MYTYTRVLADNHHTDTHSVYMSESDLSSYIVAVLINVYTNIHHMSGAQSRQTIENVHLRQLIFSRKSDCLGCAVLLCLVCLFDLACFFLSSFSSLI